MNVLNLFARWFSSPLDERLERCAYRTSRLAAATRTLSAPRSEAVELFCDAGGSIRHVRIGQWRVICASGARRIAEVHELSLGRVAVRIELDDPESLVSSSTIWELYDLQGSLLAMLQSTPDEGVWLATDHQKARVSKHPAAPYFSSLEERCR